MFSLKTAYGFLLNFNAPDRVLCLWNNMWKWEGPQKSNVFFGW
jgi:hypothetical protein